jgi:hypothetical protein
MGQGGGKPEVDTLFTWQMAKYSRKKMNKYVDIQPGNYRFEKSWICANVHAFTFVSCSPLPK